MHCPYAKVVWREALNLLDRKGSWREDSVVSCLEKWLKDAAVKEHKALPCTFENKDIPSFQVCHQIRYVYRGVWKLRKEESPRILEIPEIDKDEAPGFFNGANQGSPGICGVDGVLFLNVNHSFSFKAAFGEGTNNRAEILTLWLLMKFTSEKSMTRLQILGDSK